MESPVFSMYSSGNRKSSKVSTKYLLILILVSILVFVNTFWGEFVYDDYPIVVNNPEIKYWHFWDIWGVMGRSTRTLSLMLDYHLFGNSPFGYHFQNIFWHLTSVLLLYLVLTKLSGDRLTSFMASLLFAIHPIHVEAVANIANRKELLCMTFSLSSFLLYMQFINKRDNKRWLWLAGSLLSWYLALNSKEVAIVLPLSLVAYEYIFLPKESRWLSGRPAILSSVLFIGAIATSIYLFSGIDFSKVDHILTLGGDRGETTYYSVFLTSARAFWHYIKLLLFPFNLSPEYIIELSTSLANPSLIFLWCLKLLFLLSPFYLLRKNALVAFGLFWFVIHYIPVSNIIPLTYIVADRYMYIPSAGLCLAMAASCSNLYRYSGSKRAKVAFRRPVTVLIFLILTAYSVTTVFHNSLWKNGVSLWTQATKVASMSTKAYYNRGNTYSELGNYEKAIKDYKRAIELDPKDARAYNNRGNAYSNLGYHRQAIKDYERAIKLDPKHARAYYDRGFAYYKLGNYQQAIKGYDKAIELDPKYAMAYNNRGHVYYDLGNYQQAIKDCSKAIELEPKYARAYSNRGYVYYVLGSYQQAIKDYSKVIDIKPLDAEAHYKLGLMYKLMGVSQKSLVYYKRAAALGLKQAQDYLRDQKISN